MNCKIRKILEGKVSLLQDFLYEAVFVPEGMPAPPKSIINQPELQVYIIDFGKKKTIQVWLRKLIIRIVGAVWVRIMSDYGQALRSLRFLYVKIIGDLE